MTSINGTVVSYLKEKKYGFIKGDDNESYFLHLSSVKEGKDRIAIGSRVSFNPTAKPKGMAAEDVTVKEMSFKKELIYFCYTKDNKPKVGDIEYSVSLKTRFFKDKSDAFNHIMSLAKLSNSNCILNLKSERETFRSGNYKYSMFAFSGDLAVVTRKVPCEKTTEKEQDSENLIELNGKHIALSDYVSDFCEQAHKHKEIEGKIRDKQRSLTLWEKFCIIAFILLIIAFFTL